MDPSLIFKVGDYEFIINPGNEFITNVIKIFQDNMKIIIFKLIRQVRMTCFELDFVLTWF